jgi:ankyrin repeat protein
MIGQLLLIQTSLTVNSPMQDGDTPVHHASFNGHLDVVRYLIEKCKADVSAENEVSELERLID